MLNLVVAALVFAAAGPPRFRVQPVSVAGDVVSVIAADLDGDGRKDLLATYTTGVPPYQKRFMAVFWNREGVFAPRADLVLDFNDEESCAFDVSGQELLVITPRGVLSRGFHGRVAERPRLVAEQPTIFHQPIPGELPRLPIAHDGELLVPAVGSLTVWRRSGAGWEKSAELDIDMDVASGAAKRRVGRAGSALPAFELSYTFPTISLADFDGDGLKDIFASQEDRLAVYRRLPSGSFNRQPDYTRDFAIRTAEDRKERSSSASILVSDIDGDGAADLVLRKQVFQGVTSATSASYLFFGRKGGGYPEKPAQIIRSEGVGIFQTQLLDVTGDGRPDLIVPETTFGIFTIIRMLTAKTAVVNFQIFPFEPGRRRFAELPVAERELKFKLALSGDSDLQAVHLGADLTGDGRPDLVFGSGDDELSIFPNDPVKLFVDDAAEVVEVRSSGSVEAVDLDGKGRSDLVLYYPQTRGHRGEIVVLSNLGPW